MQVEFGPTVCVSSLGTAAVVDGSQILLTPLRHTVIPPPLAAAVVQTSQRGFDAPAVACMALRGAEGALPEVWPAAASELYRKGAGGHVLWFLPFTSRLSMRQSHGHAPLFWPQLKGEPGGVAAAVHVHLGVAWCCKSVTEAAPCCVSQVQPPLLTYMVARLASASPDIPWAQAVAAVTSDGRLAVACSREVDLWEDTALEQDNSTLPDEAAGPNEMDICEDAAPAIHACCAPLPAAAQQLLIRCS